jgi:hypothetical protein
MHKSRGFAVEQRLDCLGGFSVSFALRNETGMSDFWGQISHTETSPARSDDPVDITLVAPPPHDMLDGLNFVRDY